MIDLGAIDGPAAVAWRDMPAQDGGDNEGRRCDCLSVDSAERRPIAPAELPPGVPLPIPLLLLIATYPSIRPLLEPSYLTGRAWAL